MLGIYVYMGHNIYIYNTWKISSKGLQASSDHWHAHRNRPGRLQFAASQPSPVWQAGDHDRAFHGAGAADALDQRGLWSVAMISMTL